MEIDEGHYHALSERSHDCDWGPCTIYTAMNENFYFVVYHDHDRISVHHRGEED
jgi:hypothetical protein